MLAVIAFLLFVFQDTGRAMVSIWMRSETFAHAFLVPPIAIWLAWRRRVELAVTAIKPVPWLLGVVALVCAMWLVGDIASVNAATQFMLVSLVVVSVPAVAGWAVARVLMFPLLFLYFAVPMGEFLVPVMMSMTADFTVAALRFTGVPVYREGLQFVIPSGSWSVVEACSGVRYLIASFMVGTLFAYLNYRTIKRRLLFVLASIAVPVVANWLRAYMIVMLGHLSGNEIAVGADHLVYGWVFFGVVIGIMFFIGARWTEPDPTAPALTATLQVARTVPASTTLIWVVAAGISALVLLTQLAHFQLLQPSSAGPPSVQLPTRLGAWQQGGPLPSDWAPAYRDPSATQYVAYTRGNQTVAVWVGYYRDQSPPRELIASTNTLISPSSVTWTLVDSSTQLLAAPAGQKAIVSTMRDTADPNVRARKRLKVLQFYWVGQRFTASPAQAKLLMALQRLRGRGDDSAALMIYAAVDPSGLTDAALGDFVAAHLPDLAASLQATADKR